ncbi:cytochrome P450 [Brachybacterium sp. DNPG3]
MSMLRSLPVVDLVGLEPRSATDDQRASGPIARTPDGTWVVLGHAEAVEVASDDVRFSSAVSRFLQVPNGLDGAEHSAFRALIDRHLTPERTDALAPTVRAIADQLVDELVADAPEHGVEVDAVSEVGAVFAVRAQIAWLGWPRALEPELLQWMVDNHEASRSGDLARTAEVAERFDAIIRSVVGPRRAAGAQAPDDATTALIRDRVALPDPAVPGSTQRGLEDEEIVSILRNWTGGDLGSLALCTGVLLTALAGMPALAERVRVGTSAEAGAIVDELLRIDDPFVSNRRVTTCPVTLAGHEIPAGERVLVHWTSANRDAAAFPDPDAVDPAGNAAANVVYGVGRHVCPGRGLATMELVELLRSVLERCAVQPSDEPGEREIAPVGGWAHAPVRLLPRG